MRDCGGSAGVFVGNLGEASVLAVEQGSHSGDSSWVGVDSPLISFSFVELFGGGVEQPVGMMRGCFQPWS